MLRCSPQRVVDLEPDNVTALVGLALVDLDIRNKESFERSVAYLKRAFKLQNNHPMVRVSIPCRCNQTAPLHPSCTQGGP